MCVFLAWGSLLGPGRALLVVLANTDGKDTPLCLSALGSFDLWGQERL